MPSLRCFISLMVGTESVFSIDTLGSFGICISFSTFSAGKPFLDTSLGGVPLGFSGGGGVGEGLFCSVMSLLGSTLFLGVEWIGASGAGLEVRLGKEVATWG